jgi:hypothetical protein
MKQTLTQLIDLYVQYANGKDEDSGDLDEVILQIIDLVDPSVAIYDVDHIYGPNWHSIGLRVGTIRITKETV